MLRGGQTPGEIKGRSGRLWSFESLDEVGAALDHLEEYGLAVKLPRQPGQKEVRYVHLLSRRTSNT